MPSSKYTTTFILDESRGWRRITALTYTGTANRFCVGQVCRTYPLASLGDRNSPVKRNDVHARRCHALQQGARLVDVDDHRDFRVNCLDLFDHHALEGRTKQAHGKQLRQVKEGRTPQHAATDRLLNQVDGMCMCLTSAGEAQRLIEYGYTVTQQVIEVRTSRVERFIC